MVVANTCPDTIVATAPPVVCSCVSTAQSMESVRDALRSRRCVGAVFRAWLVGTVCQDSVSGQRVGTVFQDSLSGQYVGTVCRCSLSGQCLRMVCRDSVSGPVCDVWGWIVSGPVCRALAKCVGMACQAKRVGTAICVRDNVTVWVWDCVMVCLYFH